MSDSLRPHGLQLVRSSVHGDSPGKNTEVGCHALLQGIFPTQGSNPGLPHCRWILYHLSHQGSPRILERVAYPSSRSLLYPGIELESPALQADSSQAELPGKPKFVVTRWYNTGYSRSISALPKDHGHSFGWRVEFNI